MLCSQHAKQRKDNAAEVALYDYIERILSVVRGLDDPISRVLSVRLSRGPVLWTRAFNDPQAVGYADVHATLNELHELVQGAANIFDVSRGSHGKLRSPSAFAQWLIKNRHGLHVGELRLQQNPRGLYWLNIPRGRVRAVRIEDIEDYDDAAGRSRRGPATWLTEGGYIVFAYPGHEDVGRWRDRGVSETQIGDYKVTEIARKLNIPTVIV